MHSYSINILLNHSIVIAAVIAITRFKAIIKSFYPFILFIWLGCINETLSLILIYTTRNNTINSNIYVLLEYGIILFQFYKWNDSPLRKYLFFFLTGIAVWCADNLIINAVNENNSIFRIFYYFVIAFFNVNQINKIIVYERRSLVSNAQFLICITFLGYYSFKSFVEVSNAFHLALSNLFYRELWMILYFVNFLSNIMYAIAILCIPKKQEFSLPY
jgi:hypothetical protein